MYKITLPINYDGHRYGIEFLKGVGETDNESVAERLKKKGFIVEPVADEPASDGEQIKEPAAEGEQSEETTRAGRKK